ncbi:EF-P lysine aminoacylase EpmA [Caldichromatium japonicum]|nr:EF-P lysine aminoacylase EpmA [Caldichromatium japonicum]
MAIRARAALYARIRNFFAEAGVLEVETPILSQASVTDPALASLTTRLALPGWGDARPLYLQTSPEFAMKRLLAAGSGPIYQICKVFRDEERGRWHHPEFSLLEWYRPGWDDQRLMDEVAALVRYALERPALACERISYRALFQGRLGLDPWTAQTSQLRALAERAGIAGAERLDLDNDGWLDLLLTHLIVPELGRGCLTFIHDYPPSQAALARLRWSDGVATAARFELYVEGLELANGFHELTDAAEQEWRFLADLELRRACGQTCPPIDRHLLAALAYGLPDCAGVALGLDRLLMIALEADAIDNVLCFVIEHA